MQQHLKRQHLTREAVRRYLQKQTATTAAGNTAPIVTHAPKLPTISSKQATVEAISRGVHYIAAKIKALLSQTVRHAAQSLLALLGAGGVVLLLAMVIGAAAAVIGSPMGILFADESGDPNSIPIAEIVADSIADFGAAVNDIVSAHPECSETTITYDYEDGHTWASYWPEVLAIFAVHTNLNSDSDVVVINAAPLQRIQDTFWAMHEITYEVEEVDTTPEPTEDDKTGRLRSRILTMNKDAARFFHACLNSTVEEARQARAYWRRRGLDDKTINRFGLGYAPDDGQALYQHLRDKGYNQQELDASGLFKRSQSGRIYCLFWKRVMTPIFDLRGNIIAFGGRVLDDSKPKYVNSPETLVYHKSDTALALLIAKRSASHRYVLSEGYMDVISMHQAGIDTAVCACGTALTPEQVKLLTEYADEVVLSYDSDEAGQKATGAAWRGFPVPICRCGC